MRDHGRYFTPEEAQRTLPLVKRIVDDILHTAGEAREIGLTLEGDPESHPAIQARLQEIEGYFRELEAIGCYFKDWSFERGVVDFPAVIDGEEVYLCWDRREEHIRYYHALQEGYDQRRPIPPEYLPSR